MKSSESLELRAFAKRKYGSLAGLAHALGVKPQSMNPYFMGTKSVGEDLAIRLHELGFSARAYRGLSAGVDILGIESILGRPLDQATRSLGISDVTIEDLKAGNPIASDHLVALLNLVISVSVARLGGSISCHSQPDLAGREPLRQGNER